MNYLKILVAVLAVAAIAGSYYFPKEVVQQVVGSSAGATFSNAKYAAVVVNAVNVGANGTSTSILNTDAGSRYVTGVRYGCSGIGTSQTAYTGAGLVSWQLTVGSTTTSAPATIPTVGLLTNALVIATSTPNTAAASSTPTGALGNNALWQSGAYETFWLNATNTAMCTFGLDYVGS